MSANKSATIDMMLAKMRLPFLKKKHQFIVHGTVQKKEPGVQQPFFFICFFLFLIAVSGIIWLFFTTSPQGTITIGFLHIQTLAIFSFLLTMLFTSLSKIVTKRFIHGISVTELVLGLFVLKTNMLLQPFLVGLLLIFIIAIELAFWQRRK